MLQRYVHLCGAENETCEALTEGAEDLVARIQEFRKLSSAVGSSALDSLDCLSVTSTELRLRENRLRRTTEEQAQVSHHRRIVGHSLIIPTYSSCIYRCIHLKAPLVVLYSFSYVVMH